MPVHCLLSLVTLSVDDEQRLSGEAGCNTWFVTWALSEDTGKLGPVGATRVFGRRLVGPYSAMLTSAMLDGSCET